MRIDVDGSAETDNIFEQLLFTTVRIECFDYRGIPSCVGTGFFLQRQIEAGAYKIYLVSNRHVLDASVDSIKIQFVKARDGKPLIGDCEHISIERVSQMVIHPNVDLAILDCTALVARFPGNLYFKAASYDSLASYDNPEVNVADTVYYVGYPEGIYDALNGLPLLRTGTIASLPKADFDGLPQIVIDAQVFPGSSGSPVFSILDGSVKLVGIITQSFIKKETLKHSHSEEKHLTETPLGLGVVIKATCIKEIIDDILGEY